MDGSEGEVLTERLQYSFDPFVRWLDGLYTEDQEAGDELRIDYHDQDGVYLFFDGKSIGSLMGFTVDHKELEGSAGRREYLARYIGRQGVSKLLETIEGRRWAPNSSCEVTMDAQEAADVREARRELHQVTRAQHATIG